MLFDRCRAWLEERGESMEGPVNFGSVTSGGIVGRRFQTACIPNALHA